jgi:hypothetical protein
MPSADIPPEAARAESCEVQFAAPLHESLKYEHLCQREIATAAESAEEVAA